MPECYLTYGALISPLGRTPKENLDAILRGETGVAVDSSAGFNQTPLPLGKIPGIFENRYNTLLADALSAFIEQQQFPKNAVRTAVILSSTKGNMDAIASDTFASSRQLVETHLGNLPLTIISNACISGILAINLAADYIRAELYDKVVIIGIDAISDFVNFGFQSLFALSDAPCRPFDKSRNGTSLGEACAILLMTRQQPESYAVEFMAGSSSNDANHISGPSRTGEGLYRSIHKTLSRAGIYSPEIDFISAHGTATLYNDEMESIAFGRCELNDKPLHSLKGYFGHTLGAAGVLETLILILSMEKQLAVSSLGFEETGTSVTLNVQTENKPLQLTHVLKTASGFGGGNASLILKRLA